MAEMLWRRLGGWLNRRAGKAERSALRMICGWCAKELTWGDGPVSHGICEPCAAEWFPDDSAPTNDAQ